MPPILASATARAWLARLRGLQSLRVQFAEAPDSQRWAIQARVLQFLLDTHAADPSLDKPREPGVIGEPWVKVLAGAGKAPRGAEEIRPVLQGIAAGNEEIRSRRAAEEWYEGLQRRAEYERARAGVEHERTLRDLEETRADAQAAADEQALEYLGGLYHCDDDPVETRAVGALAAAWAAADIARGKAPLVWPELPANFVGLCVAGPLGENTLEAVATVLEFYLRCWRREAVDYARRLETAEPVLIATDQTTARSLAGELRGMGLQAEASH